MADAVLPALLLAFSIVIVVLVVLILLGIRGTARGVLQVRMFMQARRLERSFLALLASFLVFITLAIPQALTWVLDPAVSNGLLGIHLALIVYAFGEYYMAIREPKGILDGAKEA